jgi:hypothetical protein
MQIKKGLNVSTMAVSSSKDAGDPKQYVVIPLRYGELQYKKMA